MEISLSATRIEPNIASNQLSALPAMTAEEFQQHILPLKDRLFRFAMTFLGNQADAMDVVQDVLLKAWENLQKPDSGIQNPEAWCMTLTRNRSLDKLRKHGRHYVQVDEQVDLPTHEAGPLRQTVARETLKQVRAVIATLPEQQRAVIQLRDVEQYSYKEIAELLQLEVNHVKVLLHRARTRIKKYLLDQYRHES
ncbi:MAG: sigma-70 family RNA polymerase sigma factor [Bacteroidota bacterium]